MAAASPTPIMAGPVRRTSQRQALRRLPSRSLLSRADGLPPAAAPDPDSQLHQPPGHHDDSSEDEIPVPMKLSALTKALLKDDAPDLVSTAASPPRTRRRTSALNGNGAASSASTSTAAAAYERPYLRSSRMATSDGAASKPTSRENSPVRKRVVKLSNTPQSLNQMQPAKRRSSSLSRAGGGQRPARPLSRSQSRDKPPEERAESRSELHSELNTPAHGGRVVRIVAGSSSHRSRLGSSGPSSGRSHFDRSAADRSGLEAEGEPSEVPETAARHPAGLSHGSVSRYPSTRSRSDDNVNPQGSMRVKRVGKIPGSFLSGPARRGRRRQSEEDTEAEQAASGHHNLGQAAAGDAPEPSFDHPDPVSDFHSGSPLGVSIASRAVHRRQGSNSDYRAPTSGRASPNGAEAKADRARQPDQIDDDMPPIRLDMLPSFRDQENEPAAGGPVRPKTSVFPGPDKLTRRPPVAEVGMAGAASPGRRPLAPIAGNTPHRPAPPPPKMSVLETATSTAGAAAAATTQAKQRRNVLRVNGKSYTRLDCLGRGGSAKVYRVTAENGHMFALKRVSLENADETTVRGYKGEIDLLGKLSTVDRVIKLFDHEMNSEKQVLTLLMEMGELDLNKLLSSRQTPEGGRLDPVFVRFYWKEMLECLQSVHQYDIVHSDLKPANFVLVRGRLKLIDFGIANAIQTDETVNVHRETQIGTPNYMSPESLMDANNPRGGRLPGRPKLMKLGKPSDVWSLGCILYQMVYGLPPFGHIANQLARCQAIVNWNHGIEFPTRGAGGVPVPPSLLRTMRRCLSREQHMRPTCEELLHESDPFLYPAELGERTLPIDEELLGRIIQSVVARCRERIPAEAESLALWPQAYWASIKKAMAGRG